VGYKKPQSSKKSDQPEEETPIGRISKRTVRLRYDLQISIAPETIQYLDLLILNGIANSYGQAVDLAAMMAQVISSDDNLCKMVNDAMDRIKERTAAPEPGNLMPLGIKNAATSEGDG
jgi:hypothetical protein